MNQTMLRHLLEAVAQGGIRPDEAVERLREMPYADLEVAKFDGHRMLRNGFSETVLCEGKRPEHLVQIIEGVVERGHNLLGTRLTEQTVHLIRETFPQADVDEVSRTFCITPHTIEPVHKELAIVCAGTADIPIAEEARRCAAFFGIEGTRHYDVGVAGLHRLLNILPDLRRADLLIVVAGMEGALPSVVGGLISVPIIAVPTSIGYGAGQGGIAALLGMLSSCSEGITVVNIDNGFGAACAARRILCNCNDQR